MAKEYIEREALCKACVESIVKCNLCVAKEIPAADVVEVLPELRKVVELLHNEYEKAKKLDFVYDPIAYAVYQVWKAVDGRRKNGR